MRRLGMGLAMLGAVIAASCGGGSSTMSSSSGTDGGTVGTTSTPSGGFVITIANLAYSPLNLAVPPGATVTVVNTHDDMPHSVTSESAPGQYTPGAVNGISFDTGQFQNGQKTFTIPASAPAGTVIPFYCTFHRQLMATPNGSITVNPSAQPNSSGGGTTAPTTMPSSSPSAY